MARKVCVCFQNFHRTGDLGVRESERSDIGMLGRPWNRNWAHPHREFANRTICQRIESMHLHDHQRRRECFQNSRLKNGSLKQPAREQAQ